MSLSFFIIIFIKSLLKVYNFYDLSCLFKIKYIYIDDASLRLVEIHESNKMRDHCPTIKVRLCLVSTLYTTTRR